MSTRIILKTNRKILDYANDIVIFINVIKKWHILIVLCSKKQFENKAALIQTESFQITVSSKMLKSDMGQILKFKTKSKINHYLWRQIFFKGLFLEFIL